MHVHGGAFTKNGSKHVSHGSNTLSPPPGIGWSNRGVGGRVGVRVIPPGMAWVVRVRAMGGPESDSGAWVARVRGVGGPSRGRGWLSYAMGGRVDVCGVRSGDPGW
jgi:hypothetical protein